MMVISETARVYHRLKNLLPDDFAGNKQIRLFVKPGVLSIGRSA